MSTELFQGLVQVPAFPPPGGLVDTLGAGDTFNAMVIAALTGFFTTLPNGLFTRLPTGYFTRLLLDTSPFTIPSSHPLNLPSSLLAPAPTFLQVIGCLASGLGLPASVRAACQVAKLIKNSLKYGSKKKCSKRSSQPFFSEHLNVLKLQSHKNVGPDHLPAHIFLF